MVPYKLRYGFLRRMIWFYATLRYVSFLRHHNLFPCIPTVCNFRFQYIYTQMLRENHQHAVYYLHIQCIYTLDGLMTYGKLTVYYLHIQCIYT